MFRSSRTTLILISTGLVLAIGACSGLTGSAASPAAPSATIEPTPIVAPQTQPSESPSESPAPVALAPEPTLEPTPEPTPEVTPEPTPEPPPAPEIATSDRAITAGSVKRAEFRGERGAYTWTSVSFLRDYAIVRWDVTAGDSDCRIDWSLDPSSASTVRGRVTVAASDRETGRKRFRTTFADAVLRIESNCPTWLTTIQGDTPPPAPAPRPTGSTSTSNCHPSYRGACLRQNSGDYDCASGSGNGPNYVSGPISVVGYDEFDLDRDGDGLGCENG